MTEDAPGRGKGSRKKAARAKSPTESKEAAQAVLGTVEIFAVARFGAAAQFTEDERILIEPSLAKLIEQYGATVERYSGLLSLVPLVAGVISYTSRVAAIAGAQGAQEREKKPAAPKAQAPDPYVTVNGGIPPNEPLSTANTDPRSSAWGAAL